MLARYDRPVQSRRPILVVVSGAPGAGKTSLAARLSHDLSLPLLAKDELKETIAEALGAPRDVGQSQRIGQAAYALLFALARRLLDAGTGAIVESNFRRGISEPYLAPLLAASDARLIHCTAEPELLHARYADRFARGERHSVHLDGERAASLTEDLSAGRFEPLALGVPTIVVDTSHGLDPPYEELVRFIRAGAMASR
jgi:predicted kinase